MCILGTFGIQIKSFLPQGFNLGQVMEILGYNMIYQFASNMVLLKSEFYPYKTIHLVALKS